MSELVHIYTVAGWPKAEMVRMFLEAHGLTPMVSAESISITCGIPSGMTGQTRIYVPTEQAEQAVELLEAMERGEFSLPEEELTEDSEEEDLAEEDPE